MRILNHLLDLPGVHVDQVATADDHMNISGSTRTTAAPCPTCGSWATAIHSAYRRTLRDVPWGLRRVHMTLRLRRFRCAVAACPRQTFVERLPTIAPPYARATTRLKHQQQQVAFVAGGEGGARLTRQLGMATSPDTLIRLIRAAPLPTPPPPTIIGLDDWAKRKGRDYGTIIIDLERRQPIDVLPDRTAATVATWLHAHPTVTVVSRDRAEAYIDGVTRGAPQAKQIADRWHLTKNLGDAVQRMLERHGAQLRAAANLGDLASRDAAVPDQPPPPDQDRVYVLPRPHPKHHRQAQFDAVKQLRERGWSISRVAGHLGLNRRTVRRFDQVDQVPVRILPQNLSHALPFLAEVQALLQHREPTCRQVWTTLQANGFQGSYSSVHRLLKHLGWSPPRGPRQGAGADRAAQAVTRIYSARQVMWMSMRETSDLKPAEQRYWNAVCERCPAVVTSYDLTQRFLHMLRERDVTRLDSWLMDAEQSGIKELKQFAKGLRRDETAVRHALQEVWSNGPVEAHVQQLKLIKRSMKGRANFDLLRKRVLYRL
jgi:transposase